MDQNAVFFSWDRSLPGREQLSAQHFQDFMQYLTAQKQAGNIDSFDPALFELRGQGIHGFFLIRGANAKLQDLLQSEEWLKQMMRASTHLENASISRIVIGQGVLQRMQMWMQVIPK